MERSDLERALKYYKERVDELGAETLKKDYEIRGLKSEVTLRRRTFTVLSKLGADLGKVKSLSDLFERTMDSLSGVMGDDRSFVLTPSETPGTYSVSHWTGVSGLEQKYLERVTAREVALPDDFCKDPTQYLIVHSKTPPTPLTDHLKEVLELPYFICVPIVGEEKILGLLVMGRLKEGGVLYPPLHTEDIEALQVIAHWIAAVVFSKEVAVLREMDQLKSDFFANISHEFRTPITLTLGPLESFINGHFGPLSAEAHRELQSAISNQHRLLNLINEILELAKLESHSAQLRAVRLLDANQFIKNKAQEFQAVADSRGLMFQLLFDERIASKSIYFDTPKMEKVLNNLLSNAFKFTAKGFIRLETRLGKNKMMIVISDSGVGIPEDQMDGIFDRFKQAEKSQSKVQGGPGIGLAISKEIVELHGGTIEVTSDLGIGSQFIVSVPLGHAHLTPNQYIDENEDKDVAEGKRRLSSGAGEGEITSLEEEIKEVNDFNKNTLKSFKDDQYRVLFVDDSQDMRRLIASLLKNEYNLFFAINGKDGLEKALDYNVDLIISDLMMPVMSGEEFLSAVRQEPKLSRTPFIVLTARSSIRSKVNELDRGADDYLTKPFSQVELKARIRNLLKLWRTGTSIRGKGRQTNGI